MQSDINTHAHFQSHAPTRMTWRILIPTGIVDGDDVVDLGCGLGGPARAVAIRYKLCNVTGVDITSPFVSCGLAINKWYATTYERNELQQTHLPACDATSGCYPIAKVREKQSDPRRILELTTTILMVHRSQNWR